MRAFKRFTITVTEPPSEILGTPEHTFSFVATASIEDMMRVWDPFYYFTKNSHANVVSPVNL